MSWSQAKLSEVALINPRRPRIERPNEWPTSFVPMEAVDETSGEVIASITRPYSAVKKGYTYFGDGDVIFAKITPCMQNGKHAVIRGLLDGIGFGSTEFHVIRPSKSVIPEWVHYFLRRKETLNAAARTFTGTVGQQRVPPSFLESIEIPVPPLDEQRRIATRLKAQLAEVETARQAAQVQVQDVAMLRSRVLNDAFAALEDAPLKVLGDCAQTTSGSTPPRGNKQYWEPAEIPWVKTGEVAFAPIAGTEEAVSKLALAECSLPLLPPGTVLVAMYGQGKTRGQSAILEIPATTNQACFAILPNTTWEQEFLYYWLLAGYKDLREKSEDRGGNQANLNGVLLRALKVPAPDNSKQRQIAQQIKAALAELDGLNTASQAMLADLDQLPRRLLARAFQN